MVPKVNISARIKRHSRILKDNILNDRSFLAKQSGNGYKLVALIIMLIMPFYPAFSSSVYNNTQTDFYRGDVDESSIIWSYFDLGEEDSKTPILESKDSFLSINTLLNDDRDLSGTNEIIDYEVKAGESISSIAYKFKVSNRSIYDNNNFSKNHIIHPWDSIKIPPVSWLIHQIASWDTISSIAKKYAVSADKIVEQNLLALDDKLVKWNVLVIPWAKKKYPKPVYKKPTRKIVANKRKSKHKSSWYSFAKLANSQFTNSKWTYKLNWRRPFSWQPWNCTYYVASYKNVDWRWNAKNWLRNARAKWHSTWNSPSVWAIVAFSGRWYNPRYWHVWIVMDVKNDHIIVSDMNYRRLWEVTYRKVPINDRAITWYIYVN